MNDSENPQLNRLLARYLESVDSGTPIDRDQFMAEHPEHADALSRYFENVTILEQLVQTRDPSVDATVIGQPAETDPARNDQTIISGGDGSETSIAQQNQAASTVSSSGSLPIPEQFGRYKIESCLGQGAMGAVYLAHDTQLDRRVALKIPKFTDDPNGEMLQRFYREARAAATLRSPNICPVFDVGDIDGQHYITMAFIDGRPLRDFTKSQKAHPEKQIAVIIRKLALALEEAHEIGVIHRDLKPANIMMDKKGEPVVMDFGLARRSSTADDVQVTQSGAILGTPAYMSPEQVAGDQALIGARSDIYSLGIILYELITGEMPFKGNLMALLQQIALNNPTKPSELRKDIDPRLENICLKMMAGDQSKRYQSMNEVAADLETVLRNSAKRRKKEQPADTMAKPPFLAAAHEESNPILISVTQPKSVAAQLREKKTRWPGKAKQSPAAKGERSGAGASGPPRTLLFGGGFGLLLLLGIIFFVRLGKYDVQITLNDPGITLSVDGDAVHINNGGDVIRLKAGEHKLQLEKDGLTTHVESFTVTKDGKTVLTVAIVNGKLDALLNGEKPAAAATVMSTSEGAGKMVDVASVDVTPSDAANGKQTPPMPNPNGSPTSVSGERTSRETALRFSKRSDEVSVPTLFDDTDALTIEVWVQRDVTTWQPHSYIAGFGDSSGIHTDVPVPFSVPMSNLFAVKKMSESLNDGATAEAVSRLGFNQAVHVAGVRDPERGETRLYIDGALMITMTGEFHRGDGVLEICSADYQWVPGDGNDNFAFTGWIDEIRISKSVRYKQDFKPQRRFEKDSETAALYHFDEGTGDLLKDSSGNGHDGKIVGAKWVNVREASSASTSGLRFHKDGTVILNDFPEWEAESFTFEAIITAEELSGNVLESSGGALIFSPSNLCIKVPNGTEVNTREFPIGRPVHVAGVYDKGKLLIFADGKLKERKSIALFKSKFTEIRLGTRGFHGTLHELRISSNARYHEDFTPLLPDQRLASDKQTFALYHLDKDTGDVLKDSSGNGHDGKIIGAKWVNVDGQPVSPNYSLSPAGDLHTKGQIADLPKFIKLDDPMTIEMTINAFSHGTGNESRSLLSFAGRLELKQYNERLIWQRNNTGADPPAEYIPLLKLPLHTPLRVAAVSTGKQLRLFVEGKLIGTHDLAILPSSPADLINLVAWAGDAGGYKPFDGTIDEMRFSKGARYDADYVPTDRLTTDEQTVALYHCDEGTGTTLKDSSGNGHDVQLQGAKWVNADDVVEVVISPNYSLQPAGDLEGEGVVAKMPLHLKIDEAMTIEMTITPFSHAAAKESRTIVSFAGKLGLKQYGEILTWVRHNPEADPVQESVQLLELPLGKPLRVAAVSTGQQLRLFVEGKLIDTQDLKISPSGSAYHIFLSAWDVEKYEAIPFDGLIDEIRFSKVARYDADYVPIDRLATDDQTVALYHCDEGTGDILKDYSGNGHHVQLEDAQWVASDGKTVQIQREPVSINYAITPAGDLEKKGAIAELPRFIKLDDPLTIEMTITPFSHAADREHRTLIAFAGALVLKQHANALTWLRNTIDADPEYEEVRLQNLPLNKPLRIAAVSTGKQLRLFVEGKLIETQDLAVLPSSGSSRIDLNPWGDKESGHTPFDGTIDEIRISNFARYAADYIPTEWLTPDEQTLALYHCDEGTGTTLKDSSSHGHDVLLQQSKWVNQGPANTSRFGLAPVDDSDEIHRMVRLPRMMSTADPFTVEMQFVPYSYPDAKVSRSLFSIGASFELKQFARGLVWARTNPAPVSKYVAILTDDLPLGVPIQVAAISTGKEIRLFVDGKLIETLPLVNPLPVEEFPMYLGSWTSGSMYYPLDGVIQNVRISKVARYTESYRVSDQLEPDDDTLALYKFDEGAGNALKDSSGNGHHGEVFDASWVIAGGEAVTQPTENALFFDGLNDFAIAENFKFDHQQPFTMELWMRNEGTPAPAEWDALKRDVPQKQRTQSKIVSMGSLSIDQDQAVNDTYQLKAGAGAGTREGEWQGQIIGHKFVPQTGDWMHLAVQWDGSHVHFFINGVPEAESKRTFHGLGGDQQIRQFYADKWQSFFPLVIGGASISSVPDKLIFPFRGSVREFRFSAGLKYSKAFTPDVRFQTEADTKILYHFEERHGNVLSDSSGNGNDARIVGGKWVIPDPRSLPQPGLKPTGNPFGRSFIAELPGMLSTADPQTIEMLFISNSQPEGTELRLLFSIGGLFEVKQQRDTLVWLRNNTGTKPKFDDVTAPSIPVGVPVRVAAVSTGTELRLFVDGKFIEAVKLTEPLPDRRIPYLLAPLNLNTDYQRFDGVIQEVRISKVARYQESYTVSEQLEVDTETVALYKFNEGAGDVLHDSSGNGYDGEIFGAKWIKVAHDGETGSTRQSNY